MYAAIDPNEPLSQVIAQASNAEDLFEEEGIDYWFGLEQPLREACRNAHVAPEDVAFRLIARDRDVRERSKESLVSLMSDLDQQYELHLGPALIHARAAAGKLDSVKRERYIEMLDAVDRLIRNHVAIVRRTLSPVAAALDVGAAITLDEKLLRHLAMEHSILALRANDLRSALAEYEGTEFDATTRVLIRELHQHIKLSYNFIMPRLTAATRRPAGYEAW